MDVTVTDARRNFGDSAADRFTYVASDGDGHQPRRRVRWRAARSVTITGAGFTNATAVDFGTIAATNFMSTRTRRSRPPARPEAAGTVDVTVVTAGGTSATSYQFSYLAAPTVTGVSPTSGPTTGGTR